MTILQIANGYSDSKLYERMFTAMSGQQIESEIFVPVHQKKVASQQGKLCVCPCFNTMDRGLYFRKQKKILRQICARYQMDKLDVVHAHTLFSAGYTARALHQKYGLPYVTAVRNTDVNVFFRYMRHLRHIGVEIMRDAEAVVFLSPVYRNTVLKTCIPEEYRDQILRKSVVIPNGINRLFLEDQPKPRQGLPEVVRLIYVGEISRNKNLEATTEAIRHLQKRSVSAELTVVGEMKDSSYRELLEQTPFLHYHPKAAPEQIREYLQQADIFVMPSHTETFGLVYAEAISQGLPVLYTRGQGFDGQFPEGTVGFAVNDRDPDDIAGRIMDTIAQYPELSARCVASAKKFDWNTIAGEYRELYDNARGERP